jgi:ribosomal protein L37E
MTNTAATAAKCHRCGRTLTDAKSVAAGFGRTCRARITEAIKASTLTEQPVQVAKAIELIEDGGVLRVVGALFHAVSSAGTVRYEVIPVTGRCSCRAGQHGLRCYHLIAVEWVSGQTTPAVVPAPRAAVGPRPADPFAVFSTAA